MGRYTKPASEFSKNPYVDKHISGAAKLVAEQAENDFGDAMGQRLFCDMPDDTSDEPLAFDSPLEAAFWVWWQAAREIDTFVRDSLQLLRHYEWSSLEGRKYVLDFVVMPTPGERPVTRYVAERWTPIGVELDGHAFHEKTPEQATYRNQRDRALQQRNWQVFHFSYSEFTSHPQDCLWEVVECARFRYADLHAEFSNTTPPTT